jgi:hypothetical protein
MNTTTNLIKNCRTKICTWELVIEQWCWIWRVDLELLQNFFFTFAVKKKYSGVHTSARNNKYFKYNQFNLDFLETAFNVARLLSCKE